MNKTEAMAITTALRLLEKTIEDSFGYIRSDDRGVMKRDRLKELKDQIKNLIDFINGEVK